MNHIGNTDKKPHPYILSTDTVKKIFLNAIFVDMKS